MYKLLVPAVVVLGFLTASAQADHLRHVHPSHHPDHERCVRGPYNNPHCRHLHHMGDSSHYYHHYDHRHRNGLALD